MSTAITFNGNGYVVPAVGDSQWGQSLSNYLVAISTGALQKTGGSFSLTAEVDFGGTYGLKASYFKSRTTNSSATGVLRLAKTDSIGFRNNANNADLPLAINGSDQLTFGGTKVILSGAIVNADVASNAAIAYSKLNLAGGIVNADVNSSAAIALSKLAPTTAHRVVMTDSSGVLSAASRNVYNVLNYGADPTGAVDSAAAFQAAIDEALYGTVYIPYGHYKIGTTLTIVRELILRGEGMRESILEWSGGGSPMIHVTTGADNTTIESITCDNNGTATHALLIDCIRAKVSRFYTNPAVKFSTAVISTNTSVTTYNMVFRDCVFYVSANSQRTPIGLYLARGNTHVVDNCFFSGFPTSIKAGGAGGESVQNCSIINSRFETFSGSGPGYPGSNTDIGIDVVSATGLHISGCGFEFDGDEGPSVADQRCITLRAVEGGFIGGNYFNADGGNDSIISIASSDCKGVVIEGNQFTRFISSYAVEAVSGGSVWTNYIMENNVHSSDGGTRYVFDNSFTPTVTFGGGSTGITYSSRFGTAQRYGNLVTVRMFIALSNKGSSTGTIRLGGLPILSDSGGFDTPASVVCFNLSGISGALQSFVIGSGAATMRMYYMGTGSQTEIDNTNCTNSSVFEVCATYQVDVEN